MKLIECYQIDVKKVKAINFKFYYYARIVSLQSEKIKFMSITECNSIKEISDYQEVNIGKLFFFKNYLITEFNEGVNINFENFQESVKVIKDYFADMDFGIITNRTNSYSLDLGDAKKFNALFPNLKAYAVVSKSLFAKGVFEVENQFFDYNRRIFNNVEDAITWVEDSLKSII